jgi:hypothetical protein
VQGFKYKFFQLDALNAIFLSVITFKHATQLYSKEAFLGFERRLDALEFEMAQNSNSSDIFSSSK